MSTTSTPRLQLVKPTPGSAEPFDTQNHVNGNWDKVDNGLPPTVCTVATRPASPYDGQLIWETDTRALSARNNATGDWIRVAPELIGGHIRSTNDGNTSAGTEKLGIALPAGIALSQSHQYLVVLNVIMGGSVNDDLFVYRLREDTLVGTEMRQVGSTQVKTAGGLQQDTVTAIYTPGTNVSKVFVGTLQRNAGTGVGNFRIGTYLFVYRLQYSGLITSA